MFLLILFLFAVTSDYYSHLDMSQVRMDIDERPELRLGSVDFVVGKEYWVQDPSLGPNAPPREPQPLSYVFAIDISFGAVQCGLVREVVAGIRELLYPTSDTCALPVGAKIAIMTFDRAVQFFNLKVQ